MLLLYLSMITLEIPRQYSVLTSVVLIMDVTFLYETRFRGHAKGKVLDYRYVVVRLLPGTF
jgi:hypothetical protein